MDLEGGWIYMVMTSEDYERFKIGMTRGATPMRRVKQLRTSDPFISLLVSYFIPCKVHELSKWENALQQEFGPPILTHDGTESEWYRGGLGEAQEWVEAKLEEWFGNPVMGVISSNAAYRAYEDDFSSEAKDWPEFSDPPSSMS